MDKIQERAIYLALRGHNILITGVVHHFRICHLLNQQTYGWLKLYHNVLVIPVVAVTTTFLPTAGGSKAKVGHVRHVSAFRSFSGFIIALRNIPEKFRKKSSGKRNYI
jgi:hypothetical protein